jgi:hypothetical protein
MCSRAQETRPAALYGLSNGGGVVIHEMTFSVNGPELAGDGVRLPSGAGGGCELFGEHGFPFGQKPAAQGACRLSQATQLTLRKGLARRRIFGEDQRCHTTDLPGSPGHQPALKAGLCVS